MIIHVYSIIKNEEDILPYFLRHYSTFVDKIFLIDQNSTDRTMEIATANSRVCMLEHLLGAQNDEIERSHCFESLYKKYSRGVADWAIIVDADELIYHPDIITVLKKQKKLGRKLLKTTGYNMYSKTFPTTTGQIYEECYMGLRQGWFDKQIIIDPSVDFLFGMGRHHTKPPPGIEQKRCGINLLHYRYLSEWYINKRFDSRIGWYGPEKFRLHKKEALDRFINNFDKLIKVI